HRANPCEELSRKLLFFSIPRRVVRAQRLTPGLEDSQVGESRRSACYTPAGVTKCAGERHLEFHH
ncbi:MAG TPA: hypothetical protein VFG71_13715, partial [Nitrospiraceae bacterium]|nr:hypothetical protein [Nitrospiraceae bacterium]